MKFDNDAFLKAGNDLLEKLLKQREWEQIKVKLPSKQYDVIDFFSGCGGMSYGFYKLGEKKKVYRHIAAFDIDKHANDTFYSNFGSHPIDYDLGNISNKILDKIIEERRAGRQNPLILIGCAPCQGFSAHRKKDRQKKEDTRNSLVGAFGRIVAHLKPEFVIMENVPDLLSKKHISHFDEFKEILEEENYVINTEVVNMAHYGVPQKRFRTVVLASKKFKPSIPPNIIAESKDFRTVRDAIGHLDIIESGEISETDSMHQTSKHKKNTIEILAKVPKDGGFRPKGVGPKCLDNVNGFSDVYGRLFWDKPSVTITARCRTPSCGRFTHPELNRGLSVREAALLQGFPENFIFEGPFDDKFKQIGNAVPPIFSLSLAVHVLALIAENNNKMTK